MENIKISILNNSFVINRGLQLTLNRIKGVAVNAIAGHFTELDLQASDIILVNNKLFNEDVDIIKAYKTLANTRWALLKIDTLELSSLYNFEFCISINDTETELIKKIQSFIEKENKARNISSENYNLSEREKEILRHVALGLTNSEIAEKLFISQHTVIAHRKNITSKLGIKTISGLTVYALLNDLISMSDVDKLK